MEPNEALAKAGQILDEECSSPTVTYTLEAKEVAAGHSGEAALLVAGVAILNAERSIANIRSRRPRPVQENPRWWSFKSVNFDLLCAVYSQIAAGSKPEFVNAMLRRLALGGCGRARRAIYYPNWNPFVSELPLIAEFCVRNGATKMFLKALPDVQASPGQAVLLRHMEDMVALNFTIFTDAQYRELEAYANHLQVGSIQEYQQTRRTPVTKAWAGQSVELPKLFLELSEGAGGLLEECRKARYLYLKGALLEGLNLEISHDKDAVRSYLQGLGFPETLARSLDEAERLYHDNGSEFNLKASMGHLRSFLEGFHREILPAAHARFGGVCPKRWGGGLLYLRASGVLSQAEEAFASSLYTLISDEGVHPLVAEREYARLFRNVVIEYALLLLSKLVKLGLKP
jgi:hypothetical protein